MCHELRRKKECKSSTWSLPISLPILHLYPERGGGSEHFGSLGFQGERRGGSVVPYRVTECKRRTIVN